MQENGTDRKPRVWPLYAASLAELIVAAGMQGVVIAIVIIAFRPAGQGISAAVESLPTRLVEAPIFVLLLMVSGLSIVAGAFLFGWISARNRNVSVVDRLGLRWPSVSPTSMGMLLLGSVPVLLVSVGVVLLIEKVIPADQSFVKLYQEISTPWAIVFIITIGVLPGFGEELFFRGFFQRRMLQRYRPVVAIGITSVVFGLFHVTPHGIALATIIGVWLGVIAYRTNSIWPSAFCHAFINSGWNVYQVGRFRWGFPHIPPWWFNLIGGVLVLAAFAWSVHWLRHQIRENSLTPSDPGSE